MIRLAPSGVRATFVLRHPRWTLLAVSSLMTGLIFASPYATLNAAVSRIPLNEMFASHFLWLSLHAVPSGLVLIIGPFQFLQSLRARWPSIHRIGGRLYLICVLAGSIAAIASIVMTTAGFAAQVGFSLLTLAWLYSGFQAYRTARARRFAEHRVWMIRNYALSFAAVLLRVFLIAGLGYKRLVSPIPFDQLYTASIWSSIFVSSLIAEWFIISRQAEAAQSRRPLRSVPSSDQTDDRFPVAASRATCRTREAQLGS